MSHSCSADFALATKQQMLPSDGCSYSPCSNVKDGGFDCSSEFSNFAIDCSKLGHHGLGTISNHPGNDSLSSLSYAMVWCCLDLSIHSKSAYSTKPTNFASSPFFHCQAVFSPECEACCLEHPWGQEAGLYLWG